MRIASIDLDATKDYGDALGPIKMGRLSEIVAIAGRNGAGKSRLFKRVETLVQNYNSHLQQQEGLRTQIEGLSRLIASKPFGTEQSKQELAIAQKLLAVRFPLTASEPNKRLECIRFSPQVGEFEDPYSFSKGELRESASYVGFRGMPHFLRGTFAKIQFLQNQWMEATHPNAEMTQCERDSFIRDYKRLQTILSKFLQTTVTRSPEGDAKLFGFRLGYSKLSQGQAMLLQFCCSIHSSGADIDNLIVLIEEPENYLHPSAMIEVIDEISKHVPNGQLWIATHSVPLLSHFPQESIWWMEEGTVKYAGTVPQQVLGGLLGNEERVAKLADFLNLPANLAGVRFAYQSLFTPSVVESRPGDPQANRLRT